MTHSAVNGTYLVFGFRVRTGLKKKLHDDKEIINGGPSERREAMLRMK